MKKKSISLKFPNIPTTFLLSGLILMLIIGFIFFIKQIIEKPLECCDSLNYIKLAEEINHFGIVVAMQSSFRTFAYPWILSLTIKVSQLIHLPDLFFIFLMQLGVYYIALLFVTRVFCEYSSRLAGSIYIALCLNIFVIPYTGVSLTDSLYTSLALLLFAGIMKIEWEQRLLRRIPTQWIFLGAFLISLAITIRPASIWLVSPCLYCVVRLIFKKNITIFNILAACILGAIPLYIQIVLNTINYKSVTFFPVNHLGALQIQLGILYIKYGTWLGGGCPGNIYSSAALITVDSHDLNIYWYFYNSLQGIKLLFYKFIGAFDFDYLVVYPYYQPRIKWLASFFSFSILWGGILGVFTHLFTKKLLILGSRWIPLIILLSWGSVALSSALELRFTLPLLSYFILVSCVLFDYLISTRDKKLLTVMILGWLLVMPLFYHVASFIRLQSTVHWY